MYSSSNAVIRRTAIVSVAYLLPTIYLLNEHNNAPNITNENSNIVSTNGDTITASSTTTNVISSNGNNVGSVTSTSPTTTALIKKAQQFYTDNIYHQQQRFLVHLDSTRYQQSGEKRSFANYFNFWNIHLLNKALVSTSFCDSASGTNQQTPRNVVSNLGGSGSKVKVPLDPSLFLPSPNQHDPSQSSCRKIANSTYPANNPSEDRSVYGSKNGWAYGAVFDGHGGWQISDISSRVLLNLIFSKVANTKTIDEILIDQQITESFQEMEDIIVESIRPAFQFGFSEVGKVGSCVLIALKKDDHLIVANCGDCRAVLGSIDSQSNPQPTKLNREHNCREALEQIDLKRDHPNENDIVVCKNAHACYVKGRLQLTRSLGDAYLKYREFNGSPDKSRGRYIPEPYTPPYVSHKPDIIHFRLGANDRFLILGTDGLWDYLSNAEAVQIVRDGMTNNQKEEEVAAKLVERALEIAAVESGLTLAELKKLNPGRQRRSRHDDTTAVVMYF